MTKNYLIFFFIFCVSFLFCSESARCAEQNYGFIISDHIGRFKEAINNNDMTIAKREIARFEEYKKRKGTNNIYFLSKYLVSVAKDFIAKDKTDEARVIINGSLSLSPDFYQSYFILAGINIKKFETKAAMWNIVKGIRLYIRTNIDSIVAHILASMTIALFLTFFIVFLFLFIVHFKSIATEFSRIFVFFDLRMSLSIIFSLLIVISFLSIGGIFIFILMMPAILWGYMKRDGRAVVISFYIFLFLLPSIVRSISKRHVYANSRVYHALKDMTRNTWSENGFGVLRQRQKAYPDNWPVNFSIGTINKKKGRFSKAIEMFDKVLKKNTKDAQIFVNIGNALINKGDFKEAIKYYNRAKEIDGTLFEAHFNLGQALGEIGKIEEASKEFAMSMKIDSGSAVYYMNLKEDAPFNQKTLDSPLPSAAILNLNDLFKDEIETTYRSIWGVLFGKLTAQRYIIYTIISIFAAAVWHLFILNREGYSTLCATCGVIFRPTISVSGSIGGRNKCNDCITIDINAYHIDTAKKREVEERIKKYRKIKRIAFLLVNSILPGAGRIIYQKIISGSVHLLITFIIITVVSLQFILLRSGNGMGIGNILLIVSGIFYYVIANTVLRERR